VQTAWSGGKKDSIPSAKIINAATTYFKTVGTKFHHGAKGVLDQQREDASFRTKLSTVSHACNTGGGRGTHSRIASFIFVLSFVCLFVRVSRS